MSGDEKKIAPLGSGEESPNLLRYVKNVMMYLIPRASRIEVYKQAYQSVERFTIGHGLKDGDEPINESEMTAGADFFSRLRSLDVLGVGSATAIEWSEGMKLASLQRLEIPIPHSAKDWEGLTAALRSSLQLEKLTLKFDDRDLHPVLCAENRTRCADFLRDYRRILVGGAYTDWWWPLRGP
jgi:hypothetical protein